MYADVNGSSYKLWIEHAKGIWGLGSNENYIDICIGNWNRAVKHIELAIPYTGTGIISYRGQYVSWTKIKV